MGVFLAGLEAMGHHSSQEGTRHLITSAAWGMLLYHCHDSTASVTGAVSLSLSRLWTSQGYKMWVSLSWVWVTNSLFHSQPWGPVFFVNSASNIFHTYSHRKSHLFLHLTFFTRYILEILPHQDIMTCLFPFKCDKPFYGMHNLFNHSPIDYHLGYPHCFSTEIKAAMDKWAQVLLH